MEGLEKSDYQNYKVLGEDLPFEAVDVGDECGVFSVRDKEVFDQQENGRDI